MKTVGQAIEDAARDLPEGYVIEISVENGAAWVTMYGPIGVDVELPDAADRTLSDQIYAAIEVAHFLASD